MFITDKPAIVSEIVFPSGLRATCEVPMDRSDVVWDLKPNPIVDEGLRCVIAGPPIILTPAKGKKLKRFQCRCQVTNGVGKPRVKMQLNTGEWIEDTTNHDISGNETDVQPFGHPAPGEWITRIELTALPAGLNSNAPAGDEHNHATFGNFVQEY